MKKLFNFSLGGNATTSNIKEESVTLSICVCVCVFYFYFYFYLFIYFKKMKQFVKKNQPKKIMH